MHSTKLRRRLSGAAVLVMAMLAAGGAAAADFYIQAGAPSDGVGTKAKPFGALAQAQAASRAGDRLLVLPGQGGRVLDGGLVLKPRQKLIGLDQNGRALARGAAPAAKVAGGTGRAMVEVAPGAEIAGLHFDVAATPALVGPATAQADPFSSAFIHGNLFTGQASEQGDVVYAVDLDALTGSVRGVRMSDNVFRDGGIMGGIRVSQRGRSKGEYRFQRNHFSDLGARAYYVLTTEDAEAVTTILDSDADNIGRGNRNSDSILPYLMHRSSQTMLVRNYRFANTKKVGNASNTGLELWIYGGRGERSDWCAGCKVKLDIENSVFDGSVTDGIQLTNYGSNTVANVTIRNSRITNSTPRQGGGAVSLISENAQSSGNRNTLLIENSDLSGSDRYGFVVTDETPGASSVVDLGGGALGSRGRNRIVGSALGAVKTDRNSVSARNNWWGPTAPTATTTGEGVKVDFDPVLSADPRK